MADDVSEAQKLRGKLGDAMRVLTRHIEAHPEFKPSPEHFLLVWKCQALERQLDRLDNLIKDTATSADC